MEAKPTNPKQLESELNQFTGDVERWRHVLNRSVIYSPGIRYLMERAEAHWLIDAIASYLNWDVLRPANRKDPRFQSLHFWNLMVRDDRSALLFAETDRGVEPFVTQEIEYTDFPLREIAVWVGFDGQYWVLYLPSEH